MKKTVNQTVVENKKNETLETLSEMGYAPDDVFGLGVTLCSMNMKPLDIENSINPMGCHPISELTNGSKSALVVFFPPVYLMKDEDCLKLLTMALNKLTAEGVLMVTMPASFCYSELFADIRRSRKLRWIAQLPNELWPSSNTEGVVFTIWGGGESSNREGEGIFSKMDLHWVYTADVRCYLAYDENGNSYLDFDAVRNCIKNGDGRSFVCFPLSPNTKDFTPALFSKDGDKDSVFEQQVLGDLVNIELPVSDMSRGYTLVSSSLCSEPCDCSLKESTLSLAMHHSWQVKEPCVVLSSLFNKELLYSKVSADDVKSIPSLCASSRFFKITLPENSEVTEDYLLFVLQQDFVKRQLKAWTYSLECGGEISLEHIKMLKIPVPSLEEQGELVAQAKALYTAKRNLANASTQSKYVKLSAFNESELRDHICQLNSIRKVMSYYIENHDTAPNSFDKLSEQMEKFDAIYNKFIETFDSMTNTDGNTTPLDIVGFMYDYCVSYPDFPRFHFGTEFEVNKKSMEEAGFYKAIGEEDENLDILSKTIKRTVYEGEKECEIGKYIPLYTNISTEDLKRIIYCFMENVNVHGGMDEETPELDPSLYFTLDYDKERGMFTLDMYNSGNPFPKELTKEIYGRLGGACGETGRSGRGGYIIRKTIEKYGGDFDILHDEKTIRLYLPIVNVKG